MIITIDGPAGTGKSSVAQAVAERLGFDFLDTGAMYRAVALAALRDGCELDDATALARLAVGLRIAFDWSRRPPEVLLNHEPVSHLLRASDTTHAASLVATVPQVRAKLVFEQQRIGREHGQLVTEGRDQGSVVFPDSPLKVYLTATPQERARRRVEQLRKRGQTPVLADILEDIEDRDRRDAGRAVGPLRVPAGAVEIDTTELTQEQVVRQIVDLAAKGRSDEHSKRSRGGDRAVADDHNRA